MRLCCPHLANPILTFPEALVGPLSGKMPGHLTHLPHTHRWHLQFQPSFSNHWKSSNWMLCQPFRVCVANYTHHFPPKMFLYPPFLNLPRLKAYEGPVTSFTLSYILLLRKLCWNFFKISRFFSISFPPFQTLSLI